MPNKSSLLARALVALSCGIVASCVSFVTPQEAPIAPAEQTASPIGIAVTDHRTEVSGGKRKYRYYGRWRPGLYGIPAPILDPKFPAADRIAQHLKAGFQQRGVEAHTISVDPMTSSRQVAANFGPKNVRKILVIRMDNIWMDFANPLWGRNSIMYFDATAQVLNRAGNVRASNRKSFEKEFDYDANDSIVNQSIKVLAPELQSLIDSSEIRRAMAR